MFLIAFNLVVPIFNALGIFGTSLTPETVAPASWDWFGLVVTGTGIVAIISSLVFHLPVGATVFAIVFTATVIPMSATLNLMMAPFAVGSSVAVFDLLKTLIWGLLSFTFLFAFIQLSSTYTGD